jgi:putative endonuclease
VYSVYILRSKTTDHYYTGSTSKLLSRIEQHNTDASRSTKNRGPWELVHHEDFQSRSEAMRRERELKTGKGREELKRLLAGGSQLA